MELGALESRVGQADKFHSTEFGGLERCKEICKWTGQEGVSEPAMKVKDGLRKEDEEVAVNFYIVLSMYQALF